MENNNQKQQQQSDNSNKKESTNSGGNDDTPSTTSPPPKDIIHSDVCSICMDNVSMLDTTSFRLYTCCGKVIHTKCLNDLRGSKLSAETRNSCPMCRAPNVPAGSKEEIERLQRWTQRDRSWAQSCLGALYAQGLGVNRDPKRAFVLTKLAADQGHHIAQYNLGHWYAEGRGVIQSDELSFKFYKLAAECGHDDAQFQTGTCYYKGRGVDKSDTEACKFYKLAADQGYCIAQFALGSMYDHGRGVIQSDTLALKFFKLAAEQEVAKQEVANAKYNVGNYYYKGIGVEQSNAKAREWWTKAATQGQEEAIENLRILDKMEGTKTSSSSSSTIRFVNFSSSCAYCPNGWANIAVPITVNSNPKSSGCSTSLSFISDIDKNK